MKYNEGRLNDFTVDGYPDQQPAVRRPGGDDPGRARGDAADLRGVPFQLADLGA